jgi:hypothetical protein
MVATALVVAGGGAWWWFHRAAGPPAGTTLVVTPAVAPLPAAAEEPPRPVPADRLRELLEAISASPTWRAWLKPAEVVERWALVTDNLAEGVSPRRSLRALGPKGAFSTSRRGDRQAISAAAYARHDLFADAVGSIDVEAAVRAYRELHGPLEAAYRALGYPQGSLDKVTAAALRRVAGAPVRDGDVFVEPDSAGPGALYLFADPALERLGAVEKQLLRMGPRNTRIIQAKARQLARALGFAAAPAP